MKKLLFTLLALIPVVAFGQSGGAQGAGSSGTSSSSLTYAADSTDGATARGPNFYVGGVANITGVTQANNNIYLNAPDDTERTFEFRKATMDASHIRYYFSHRSNNTDWWIYSYNGTAFRNWLKLIPSGPYAAFPSGVKVGINVEDPDQALEVDGIIKISGTSANGFHLYRSGVIIGGCTTGSSRLSFNGYANHDISFLDDSDTPGIIIKDGGAVGIGTLSPNTAAGLSVLGDIALFNSAGNPTPAADQAFIFAKDVASSSEVFVMDEAGNSTQISPHDPDTGEWIYYSVNEKTGKILRVEMEQLIKDLAEMMSEKTGKTYIHEEIRK